MGSGFEYKCSKCNNEYGITLGIGMMYPVVYKELVDEVKNGAFGEEWKQLFDNTENIAVDEMHLLIRRGRARFAVNAEKKHFFRQVR